MSLSTITVSGTDYTVYASVAEADVVLSVDPTRRVIWATKTNDEKGLFLIASTERLDLLNWKGKRAGGSAQARAWPRTGLEYQDGTDVPDDAVPSALERATALLAGSIAIRPSHAEHGDETQSISELRAGSVVVKYATALIASAARDSSPLQDETAYQLIAMWIGAAQFAAFGPVATGTDARSSFCDPDRHRYDGVP